MPETTDPLAEIQARAAKATPGPWDQYPEYGPNFYANITGSYLEGIGDLNFGEGDQADADREFTINARTDMDWLVGEVVRLRAETQTLGTEKGVLEDRFARLVAELDTLRGDNADLRRENAGYEKCFAPDGRAA